MANVKPIPDGYRAVAPYLIVQGASRAIEFYVKVFGARERMRMGAPGGKIGHAELEIGDCVVMLADEHPEMGARAPQAFGGSPVMIAVYVPDVDAAYGRALAMGAKALRTVENQFYGDRAGTFVDPFGHSWHVATHVEDVSPQEMERRGAEAAKKKPT